MIEDLGPRGQRLWANLLLQDVSLQDEANPAREVALTACRTADRLEVLEQAAAAEDPTVDTKSGVVTNPVYAEARQQAAMLSRLIAALRMPDEATGKKPQHRQIRGVRQPNTLAASSLERARLAKSG